jgi:hypothetical protein
MDHPDVPRCRRTGASGANPAERGNAVSEAYFKQILPWLKTKDIRGITIAEGCRTLRAASAR